MPSKSNGKEVRGKRAFAYDYLHRLIISCELKPGSYIDEKEHAEILGMSITPIREAIQRLQSEGLVNYIKGKGAFVSDFRIEEVVDLFEFRDILESAAVQKCIDSFTQENFEDLRAILDREISTFSSANIESVEAANAFHTYLAERCGNQYIRNGLLSVLERMVRLSMYQIGHNENVAKDHYSILEALENRDKERAVELVHQHMQNAKRSHIVKFIGIGSENYI
jgi:DNA-binding GntR family transcriptional regulator